MVSESDRSNETLAESSLNDLAHQPENIYIKPDLPGNNQDGLTDSEEGTLDSASQINFADSSRTAERRSLRSQSGEQNLESRAGSELDNLAHQPENIYIKPDVPGNNQNSLTDSEEGTLDSASQTSTLDSCSTLSPSKKPETPVESSSNNLAHQPENIYIKPDVPGYPRFDRGNL